MLCLNVNKVCLINAYKSLFYVYESCASWFSASRDQGEVLAEVLKVMLWEGKQHDMQRAAAFVKRLATFSLSYGSAEAMAGICLSKLFCFVILFILLHLNIVSEIEKSMKKLHISLAIYFEFSFCFLF